MTTISRIIETVSLDVAFIPIWQLEYAHM